MFFRFLQFQHLIRGAGEKETGIAVFYFFCFRKLFYVEPAGNRFKIPGALVFYQRIEALVFIVFDQIDFRTGNIAVIFSQCVGTVRMGISTSVHLRTENRAQSLSIRQMKSAVNNIPYRMKNGTGSA